MSDIVLSASVRQNLLSLQSTADLLATTQNRLSTGKKVNTALDNPTNYFTAAALDNRASDINNLLDGIGNGVQVLQAANTGISSLQKLVDSAKSVANQALQSRRRLFDQVHGRPRPRSPARPPEPARHALVRDRCGCDVGLGRHEQPDRCGRHRPARPCCRARANSDSVTTDFTGGGHHRRQRHDDHLQQRRRHHRFGDGGHARHRRHHRRRGGRARPRSTRSPARRSLRRSRAARVTAAHRHGAATLSPAAPALPASA